MADNLPQNGGGIIATDEVTTLNGAPVSPVHAQRMKITFGYDGFAQDVTLRDPLPTRDEITTELLGMVRSALAYLSYNTNSALRVDLVASPAVSVSSGTVTTTNTSVLGSVGVSGAGNMSAAYDQYQQMMIAATSIRSQISVS
jgi:hypothetical protein